MSFLKMHSKCELQLNILSYEDENELENKINRISRTLNAKRKTTN
jgi:hypothetical protein